MSISIEQEAALVASLRPSASEMAQLETAIHTILTGLRKGRRGWRLDPDLRRLVGRRDPASVRRTVLRGQKVLTEARRIMDENRG